MTKIDETKQYKFSEIVRMLEEKELPVGTVVEQKGTTLFVEKGGKYYGLASEKNCTYVVTKIGSGQMSIK
ncbi:hypothetical protein AB6860_02945 [Carnobacterium divergens]|uniref:hypothetical protein n=1 Tax=Carnobacterium divergens TaxID=2748 RepID=UPI0039C8F93A